MNIMKKIFFLFFFLINLFFLFPQTNLNKLSTEDKILGLSIIWKEVSYNFAYFERLPQIDWDNKYKEYLVKVINSQNDYEYYILLQEFMSILQEGHTYIIMPNYMQNMIYSNLRELWFSYNWVDNNMYVTSTRKKIEKELPIGSQIVKINNLTIAEYINIYRARINTPFEHTFKANLINYFQFDLNNYPQNIEYIKPDGKKMFFEFDTANPKGLDWTQLSDFDIQKYIRINPNFTWIADSIAYFDMAGNMDENLLHFFDSIYPAITKAKGLVVDLRYSQGGSSVGSHMIMHFIENDTIVNYVQTRINNAHKKAFGAFSDSTIVSYFGGKIRNQQFNDFYNDLSFERDSFLIINTIPKANRCKIPIVFLIDSYVGSATENLLITLKSLDIGTFVGEPTVGSCTQPLIVKLPSNGFALIATQKTMLNKNEVFTYIKPDIEVKRTLEEIMSGKDKIFEVGLEVLKEKIRIKAK